MVQSEPSWDVYNSFIAVIRHGSLSAAARELGLTQPTVGRHIDQMEVACGVSLFIRSASGLLPTEAARELRPHAEQMAASAAALERAAASYGSTVRGTVRISASEMIGVEVLPPILAGLQDAHPDLVIELSASDAVEDLTRQEADIAVRMVRPAQGALIARRIGAVPLGFFAHRRYLAQHGMPTELSMLAAHRIIGFDRQTAFIRAMRKRLPQLDDIRFSFRTDSNLGQLAAIRAGLGIGICQTGLARRDPDLVRVLANEFDVPLETWIAMHETQTSAPRCRVTFDALAKGLAAYIGGLG